MFTLIRACPDKSRYPCLFPASHHTWVIKRPTEGQPDLHTHRRDTPHSAVQAQGSTKVPANLSKRMAMTLVCEP
ncbi:hypothetical protein Tcan_18927 [Toxocara canis]|uniref:Uncharacterized protein n=1 Tax=Toxocara canis TaxID=6265 RepID=A0A0B2UPF8_TOXCA|nr:hypothetical protein Tcan_18927 [Toxocara canis]